MKRPQHRWVKAAIPLGIIVAVITFFFARLFISGPHLFVTPDLGQSDAFMLNYPGKYSLHQALQSGSLPLWNKYIGEGFPQLAENQIGVFNATNLVVYSILPFVLALNTSYVLIYFLSAIGAFIYLRYLKQTIVASVMGSLLFTFSGYFVTHMAHINLIHASAYLPFVFLFTHLALTHKSYIWFPILSLVLAQQFFAGFPQISFITGIGIGLLALYLLIFERTTKKRFAMLILAVMWVFILSAAQLLPTKEFLDISTRDAGFDLPGATRFSFPFEHFSTFFDPYSLGTPQDGSYDFTADSLRGSIYWENNGYVGVIPLLLAFAAFLVIIKKKKKSVVIFYGSLIVISAALMTGKHSPLYFIFTFIPFNYFRVPSRFILLFVWGLTVLSAYGLTYIQKYLKKRYSSFAADFVGICVLILAVAQLLSFSYSYNPIDSADAWLNSPEVVKKIEPQHRIYTFGSAVLWNEIFMNRGWSNISEYYTQLNYVRPNYNIFSNISSFQVYPILTTNRFNVMTKFIEGNMSVGNTGIEISPMGERLLKLNNVKYIISHFSSEELDVAEEFEALDTTIKLYELDEPLLRARIVYDYEIVTTVNELGERFADVDFDLGKYVLLENELSDFESGQENTTNQIEWQLDDHDHIQLQVDTSHSGILVLADSYYPGWNAYLNDKQVEVLPANGQHKAIVIPSGVHEVEFVYEPESVTRGVIISGIAHALTILLVGALVLLKFVRKAPSTS